LTWCSADLVDKETADLTATNLAKANKIKLAEDRHKQNIDALTNLQKAVVSSWGYKGGPS